MYLWNSRLKKELASNEWGFYQNTPYGGSDPSAPTALQWAPQPVRADGSESPHAKCSDKIRTRFQSEGVLLKYINVTYNPHLTPDIFSVVIRSSSNLSKSLKGIDIILYLNFISQCASSPIANRELRREGPSSETKPRSYM